MGVWAHREAENDGFPGRSSGSWWGIQLSGVMVWMVLLLGHEGQPPVSRRPVELQRDACGERRPLRPSTADGAQGLSSTAQRRAGKATTSAAAGTLWPR